jgi:hypothetical protein
MPPSSRRARRARRSRNRRRLAWALISSAALVAILVMALAARVALVQTDVEPRHTAASLSPVPESKVDRIAEAAEQIVEERNAQITENVDAYLAERGVRMSVSVEDLASGIGYHYGEHDQYATASTIKVNILAALLLQAQEEDRSLTDGERSLAREMITVSGNDPTNTLHQSIGSSSGFAEAMDRFDFSETDPGAGGVWGTTQTTTADQLKLLRGIATEDSPLSEGSRDYIRELMREVTPEQVWGASVAAGPEDTVEIKNGWVPRDADGGLWTVNSIAHVHGEERALLIAVYSDGHISEASGIEAVEAVVAEVMNGLFPERGNGEDDGDDDDEDENPPDDEDDEGDGS